MSENRKASNIKNKITIILSLILVFIVLGSFIYSIITLILEPVSIITVEQGRIYQEENTNGYIIRDEKVLRGEHYQNGLIEIKSEGTKVSKGENIFRYYSDNEESLKEKIAALDIQIGEALEGQTEVYSADIQVLDRQIENNLQKLLATNNLNEMREYKTIISNDLIKKAKIAGELSPSGTYINKQIEQRRKYEEELNNRTRICKNRQKRSSII